MEGNYNPEKIEQKWQQKWEEKDTYRYKGGEGEVFSIDTPPPTVSGNLHFGHTYGNTLTDFQARFQRMRGKDVFFPFGYDNNGIASERLTEKELGIKHQNFERREFQKKVREVCTEYEQEFEDIMKEFAFSMDWNNTYKTIDPEVQKVSQLSFIDLYEQDREYRKKGPAIWCPECETAISQVETEDAERHSHFNDIEFPLATGNGSVIISTTRPELLPACVALFVHPDDESNNHLAGEKVEVPLFDYEVPIIEDERVDMETGTGVVMCCTFGDQNDIDWYQAHNLDLRVAIDRDGTMTDLAEDYHGMDTKEAREKIVEDLDSEGLLVDRREITHTVQVHERCDEDIEFMVTEQWYVELLDHKDKYLEAGEEMDWFPEKMFTRYKNWIEGLQWDWCISRQRDSGIPFPVWYCDDCGEEVIADKENLPVDPIEDEAPISECPECGHDEFRPEKDVFDTWATSSLTPLINAGWHWDPESEEYEMKRPELYQFNLRPEGHDIISFWLFHTVVKCYEHTGETPFEGTMNHGHVLDENREKMSKSRGNVTTPQEILEDYPVDAARYWAGAVKPGDDLPLKEKDLISGEKLLRKLWNASKLVDNLTPHERSDFNEEKLEEVDKWIFAELDDTLEEVTEHMDAYEFSKARDKLRYFFWHTFCDDYLEIAKQRLDGENNSSAEYALQEVHRAIVKMFAPFIPHITEEIWNQMHENNTIHRAKWPEESEVEADLEAGETAMEVISALRKYKSSNQMALNEELNSVTVYGNIAGMEEAIKETMHIQNLASEEGEPETEKKIIDIDLNYSKAGPKYGDKVSEIEEALENEEFMIDGGRLEVAGEHLKPEMFKVREERKYTGEGEMLETEKALVVVQ
ncbi:valine--tRNA ligase [Candidatus Nanohalovita haloferacivicina]|uniref:valine--tRNA ligase n=1 Tax=Candidatus Nanohalovita haloferacivicina TaxID=2978046 RepID=UPI00325FB572|nr:Valyl-tRNA synthetase [Candidatus Nanohalobia archaeon BNXNv]